MISNGRPTEPGAHHNHGSGIFEFLAQLPAELDRQEVRCLLPSQAIDLFGQQSHYVSLPETPVTWAGLHGGQEFFVGNDFQRAVLRLIITAINHALLLNDPKLEEIALWLLQSDHLHWLQWINNSGSEGDVSAYFTPEPWHQLGVDRMVWEHQCVYKNFIAAMSSS